MVQAADSGPESHACIVEGELAGSVTEDEEGTVVLIRKNGEETIAMIFNCSSSAKNLMSTRRSTICLPKTPLMEM